MSLRPRHKRRPRDTLSRKRNILRDRDVSLSRVSRAFVLQLVKRTTDTQHRNAILIWLRYKYYSDRPIR